MFLGMRRDDLTAHVKPLKIRETLSETILSQTDTGGATIMTRLDLSDHKNLIGVVGWMVIGDGNLTLRGRQKNAFFQCTHKDSCEDYIRLKEVILRSVSGVSVKRCWHSRAGQYFWQIWTQCHPIYTQLYRGIYLNKRKTITPHSVKTLNEMALAIFYQDDGRFNTTKGDVTINKPLLSIPELELIAKYIVDKFGVIFRIRKSCVLKDGTQGHELAIRQKDVQRFFDIVSPYIVPSMLYKVGRGGTSSEVVI